MTAGALAVALLLAACGGGTSTPPAVADTTLPTMSVSNNAAATGATGPVTYTITSSEPVTFSATNITVTGGTKGALTVVDSTHATFVVTPTPNATGSVAVSFGAGVAVDASNNASAANSAASPTITFNTIPAGAGNTGACATTATVNCFNFDEATFTFTPFGNILIAESVADPRNAANKVLKVIKPVIGETWAGVTLSTAANTTVPIFGLSSNKIVTLRVYSPAAGTPILLKLENAADGNQAIEKQVLTTSANAWETLTFDFTGFNSATLYNKVSVFPNFGRTETAANTYYFDELKYTIGTAPVVVPPVVSCAATATLHCFGFQETTLAYEPFEGLVSAAQSDDPVVATNKVGKIVKGPNGQTWAGVTIYTTFAGFKMPTVNLASSKIITLRVYSPAVGIPHNLKLENSADGGINLLKTVNSTKANEWETLTFDFTSPTQGIFSPTAVYNKINFFPNFLGVETSNKTYYIDDLKYAITP
jgi:hypothetical protein